MSDVRMFEMTYVCRCIHENSFQILIEETKASRMIGAGAFDRRSIVQSRECRTVKSCLFAFGTLITIINDVFSLEFVVGILKNVFGKIHLLIYYNIKDRKPSKFTNNRFKKDKSLK